MQDLSGGGPARRRTRQEEDPGRSRTWAEAGPGRSETGQEEDPPGGGPGQVQDPDSLAPPNGRTLTCGERMGRCTQRRRVPFSFLRKTTLSHFCFENSVASPPPGCFGLQRAGAPLRQICYVVACVLMSLCICQVRSMGRRANEGNTRRTEGAATRG